MTELETPWKEIEAGTYDFRDLDIKELIDSQNLYVFPGNTRRAQHLVAEGQNETICERLSVPVRQDGKLNKRRVAALKHRDKPWSRYCDNCFRRLTAEEKQKLKDEVEQ